MNYSLDIKSCLKLKNNHQYLNAKELLDNKACVLLEEKDLSSDTLLNSIDKIISNKELYNELSSNTKKIGIKDIFTSKKDILMICPVMDLSELEKHKIQFKVT